MEQQIKLTDKIYACRRRAKQMLGGNYQAVMLPFIRRIRDRMMLKKTDELLAARSLAEKHSAPGDTGGIRILFMAAAVEMLEPSEKGVGL